MLYTSNDIDDIITLAGQTCDCLRKKAQRELIYKNQIVLEKEPLIIYGLKRALQWAKDLFLNNADFQALAAYLKHKCEGYGCVNNACVPPTITTQPVSKTVSSGSNVTFSIVAAGSSPKSYQWKKDGNAISGATSSSLTLSSVDSGDEGAYTCVVTNACGTATSSSASLSLSVSLSGSYWYGDTDPYTDLAAGTDVLTYNGTFSITHNGSLSVPFPTAANNNKYLVVRVPVGESLKTSWYNSPLNNGSIPDSAFRAALQPAGLPNYTYYISRSQLSNDFSNPLILS